MKNSKYLSGGFTNKTILPSSNIDYDTEKCFNDLRVECKSVIIKPITIKDYKEFENKFNWKGESNA